METTKEQADRKIHEKLVNNLQELLQKNYDAEKGFAKAMQDAKDGNLKTYLKKQAARRGQFANELDKEIRSLNETPKEKGSITGDLHRTWIDIKAAVSGSNDEAVLEECIRGDKASVEEYENRLKEHTFPQHISSVLSNQLRDIKDTLDKVKTLEDVEENWN